MTEALTLFPEKTIELKIGYKDYLTAEQVAVFYSGLNEILAQHNITDAKFVIEKGTLTTKIRTSIFNASLLIITSYCSPQSQPEIKNSLNFTNSFNNNNFYFFSIEVR